MDTNPVTSVALIMSRVFWFYPSYEQTIIGQNANVLKVSRQQLCTIHLPRDHRCWLSRGRAIPDESRTCINFSVRRCEYKLCKEIRIIHKLDLVSASGWLKQIFSQSEALSRSGKRHVIRNEFRQSFLRRHFAGKPFVTSRNVGCLLRLQ